MIIMLWFVRVSPSVTIVGVEVLHMPFMAAILQRSVIFLVSFSLFAVDLILNTMANNNIAHVCTDVLKNFAHHANLFYFATICILFKVYIATVHRQMKYALTKNWTKLCAQSHISNEKCLNRYTISNDKEREVLGRLQNSQALYLVLVKLVKKFNAECFNPTYLSWHTSITVYCVIRAVLCIINVLTDMWYILSVKFRLTMMSVSITCIMFCYLLYCTQLLETVVSKIIALFY